MKKSSRFYYLFILLLFTFSIPTFGQLSPIDDVSACLSYVLPPIQGQNLSGDEAYYLSPNGQGAPLKPEDQITESNIVFVQATINGQIEEECFIVNIIENTPRLDTIPDIYACVEYYLPKPAGQFLTPYAGYYTQPNGQGPFFSPGTRIDRSLRLYAYDGTPGCESEQIFEVSIAKQPELYNKNDTVACGDFELPEIDGFHIPQGAYYKDIYSGITYNPGDLISRSSTFEIIADTSGCVERDTLKIFVNGDWEKGILPDTAVCDFFDLKDYLFRHGINVISPNLEISGNGNFYYKLDNIVSVRYEKLFVRDIITNTGDSCLYQDTFNITYQSTIAREAYNRAILCRNQDYNLLSLYNNFRLEDNFYFETEDGRIIQDHILRKDLLPAGAYRLKLIYFDSTACDKQRDTVPFDLTLVDDCFPSDTITQERCSIYRYHNLGLPGGLEVYDGSYNFIGPSRGFSITPNNTGTFNYFLIGLTTDSLLDTSVIEINILPPEPISFSVDKLELCYQECQTINLVPLSETDSLLIMLDVVKKGNRDSLITQKFLGKSFTVCYDALMDVHASKDTVVLPFNNTKYEIFLNRNLTILFSVQSGCFSPLEDTLIIETSENTSFLYQGTLCPGESFEIENQVFNQNRPFGNFVSRTQAHNGCDSIIIVDLSFYENLDTIVQFVFCEPDTFYYNCTAFHPGYTFERQTLAGASEQGCDSIVNISVLFFEAELINIDTVLCPFDSLKLLGNTYTEPGQYFDTLKNNLGCDQFIYSILIEFSDIVIDSINIEYSCNNQSTLTAFGIFDQLNWSTGEVNNNILVFNNQGYSVTATDNSGCIDTDSIYVPAVIPPVISGDSIYFVSKGNNFRPQLTIQGDYTFIEWPDLPIVDCNNCLNPLIRPENDQTIWITVFYRDGCTVDYPIQIILETQFYLPNIIHPDSDQPLNQRLFLQGSSDEVIYDIQVFDRWGTTVFVAEDLLINDASSGWDGTFNGEAMSQGVYVYSIKYIDQRTGRTGVLSGDVLVAR